VNFPLHNERTHQKGSHRTPGWCKSGKDKFKALNKVVKQKAGCINLQYALIDSGLNDLGSANKVYHDDAREWFDSNSQHYGSFLYACQMTGEDPAVIREWLSDEEKAVKSFKKVRSSCLLRARRDDIDEEEFI
jgi:hypothetical protein